MNIQAIQTTMYHPTISSSVVPFSSSPRSFPVLGSFPVSQLFASGDQKCWSFSFNISPSSEHPELVSCRMDWLDLLAVQGTLKSLLQHHSLKASILQHSAFFTVQLSHPYMTTGKTIALTRWTFVEKPVAIASFRFCPVDTNFPRYISSRVKVSSILSLSGETFFFFFPLLSRRAK